MANRKYDPPPAGAIYYNVREAAWLLRCGRDFVEAEIKAGRIKARIVGRQYLIPATEFPGVCHV
jgi:excisionase family DNA binding protein